MILANWEFRKFVSKFMSSHWKKKFPELYVSPKLYYIDSVQSPIAFLVIYLDIRKYRLKEVEKLCHAET